MITKVSLTASIVLHKENIEEVIKTIQCFLATPISKRLYLIDNTKNNFFEGKLETENVKYIPNSKNVGFGVGHNQIITEINHFSDYHLILNPDVTFEPELIGDLIKSFKNHENLAMIAPRVVFPDGEHQYSCRRYPTISELIIRRFGFLKNIYKDKVYEGEYRDVDLSEPFYPEYLTGCFHLYKTSDFVSLNGFDSRYFLYMEDIDICKKIDNIGKKKLYFPNQEITHVLKKGSSKKLKLLLYHVSSAIKYFLKWGF